jgi:hypothetical protein
MREKSGPEKQPAAIKDVRRATRWHFSGKELTPTTPYGQLK